MQDPLLKLSVKKPVNVRASGLSLFVMGSHTKDGNTTEDT